MPIINSPDSLGTSCDLVHHAIQFQYFYSNGLPNHPNYFLGCDTASNCTCMTTGVQNLIKTNNLKVLSIPTKGPLTIQFNDQTLPGEMEIYDILGNLVPKENISPWSQLMKIETGNLTVGIYFLKMQWGSIQTSLKIIKD